MLSAILLVAAYNFYIICLSITHYIVLCTYVYVHVPVTLKRVQFLIDSRKYIYTKNNDNLFVIHNSIFIF